MTQIGRLKRAASRAWTDSHFGPRRLVVLALQQCRQLQEMKELLLLRRQLRIADRLLADFGTLVQQQQKQIAGLELNLKQRCQQIEQLQRERDRLEEVSKSPRQPRQLRFPIQPADIDRVKLPKPTVKPWEHLEGTTEEVLDKMTYAQKMTSAIDPRNAGVGVFKTWRGHDADAHWINQMAGSVQSLGLTQTLVNVLAVLRWGFSAEQVQYYVDVQGRRQLRRCPSSVTPITAKEKERRIAILKTTVESTFDAEIINADRRAADAVCMHQDAFARNYDPDGYMLLGALVKYLGLHGVRFMISGTNGEMGDTPLPPLSKVVNVRGGDFFTHSFAELAERPSVERPKE